MKRFFLGLALIFSALTAFAAYNSWGIPDSSEIRSGLIEAWFEASLEDVRMKLPEIYSNSAGERFQVRLEENDSTFNIFVAPRAVINVKVYSGKGVTTETQDIYPGDMAGSWVLVRDKKTEKPLRIRYYFTADSEVFVQFSPYGRTALADMSIFGNYAARGASTGVSFRSFYSASFQDVLDMTQKSLPWHYVTVDNTLYHSVLQDAAVIQEKLPRILYTQDAMYDENGNLVRITNGHPLEPFLSSEDGNSRLYLSSAGFLKWIADGLVKPVAGGLLKRAPLLEETVTVKENGYMGVLSQEYNLYFALDWVRNLSTAVTSVYTGRQYMHGASGTDVTISPFASSISENGITNTVTFIENTGYNVRILKSLLYVLAATEPGTMYFGAIRQTDRTARPEIHVFNENVVFLPYFDGNNRFRCFVFMNGRSLTLEDFLLVYNEDFTYLTRVRASEEFYPE